jgi:manganese oxidase
MKYKHHTYRRRKPSFLLVLPFFMLLLMTVSTQAQTTPVCERTVKADVVALDQVIVYNRLGTVNPGGMIYALKQDVVAIDPLKGLVAGNVRLRSDKRPRPIVLRMNNGDCLRVNFTNLLSPGPKSHQDPEDPFSNQPATRSTGVHVNGMELVGSIGSDGSNVGTNPPSLVGPGGSTVYTLAATREGNNLMYSTAATTGGEGDGGTLSEGLFGSVNVEVRGAEWYRSQLTAAEMALATVKNADGTPKVTPAGQPVLNYDAVYPAGHPRAGKPIIKMLNVDTIVHTDLNAIITGPNKGRFPAGTYRPNATEPDRDRPFREFTVIYHDEIQDIQAFPQFRDPVLKHTLHSVEDKFAINYGVAGVGAEILANRLGVGPMFNCTECKFEEFFLSSWTIGDPAQIVDKPANTTDSAGNLILGRKATKVLYPDDPSNVHHSYIGDPVKMRVVHAGPKEHHIHHLHAHQWLQTPDDDNSTYLDSQAVGPGFAFTTEIVHGGTGNRNQVVGDSIFHCHFYPHFAEGMWELWRAHDVFESGTVLNSSGIPVAGARALPDGEILAGTPTPAIVPLPTLAMAPMPTATVPGYPFFSPAVAGHRPPHPPLDTIDDGGLPRHIITGGTVVFHKEHLPQFSLEKARLDFDKTLVTAQAVAISEIGTAAEIAAMQYHEVRLHPSFKPDGTAANFILNGLPRKPGAPFADPCIDDVGNAKGTPRTYKAAAFQLDMKLNKAGWHFPQSRILSLWADVGPTQAGTKPPEPFFFRANTNDCITFHHTNLVPGVYLQDDFQVRTPTDIIGQHIHLVKFDVTSSDGSGNGFNYEDGTFSPDEVRERIIAIRKQNSCVGLESGDVRDGTFTCPTGKLHPFFGTKYAQTTVQRWFADDTLNNNGKDRTLRTVFTHDHFGPSTHQQAGLYAGLVIEPTGSVWKNPETGVTLGTRTVDGGPTSWQANIIETVAANSHREFLFEFADFQLAYQAGAGIGPDGQAIADPQGVINPPILNEVGLPFIVENGMVCPGGFPAPCPEAISAADQGTMSVNYRNEPVPFRVRNPSTNTQASGAAGDLSKVYKSNITRADPLFNVQPTFYPALTKGVEPGDPFTPLLRAYENDKVQIRILVGAHEETHNLTINGHKWLHQPGTPQDPLAVNNSGFRNSQIAGISEHFEFITGKESLMGGRPFIDYLYQNSASVDGQWNGVWGILRVYNGRNGLKTDLLALPNNTAGAAPSSTNDGSFPTDINFPSGATDFLDSTDSSVLKDSTATTDTKLMSGTMKGTDTTSTTKFTYNADGSVNTLLNTDNALTPSADVEETIDGGLIGGGGGGATKTIVTSNPTDFPTGKSVQAGVCPGTAPKRDISVTAVNALAIAGGTLVYNSRAGNGGALNDPTAIMYFRSEDVDRQGRVKKNVTIEPLVVRASAGECINFTLLNRLPATQLDLAGFNTMSNLIFHFNANQVKPSSQVGLHPQLVSYNVANSDGKNVGFNPNQTIGPGGIARYRWYAGEIVVNGSQRVAVPIEFGATNLISSDPIKHSNKGAIGSLIIEPQGSSWIEDRDTRAQATVTKTDGTSFREFVVQHQTDINMRFADNSPVPNLAGPNGAEDPEDSAQKAINYRTEPLWKRMNYAPQTPFEKTRDFDFTNVLTNAIVGGDPETPIFTAQAGQMVRFRILNANGHMRNNVFNLHGHFWQEEPFMSNSKVIGNNPLSEFKGALYGIGPSSHYEVIPVNGAGGARRITGDYLYRTQESFMFDGGIWGIFRVSP